MDFDCSRWTVVQLKGELRQHGLPVSGLKAILCQRLTNYYQINGIIPPSPGISRRNPSARSTSPTLSYRVPIVTVPRPVSPVLPVIQGAPRYTEKQIRECHPDQDGNIIDGITSEIIPPERVVAVPAPPIFNCFDVETVLDIVKESNGQPLNPYNKQPIPINIINQALVYGNKKEEAIRELALLIVDGHKQDALAKIRQIGNLKGTFKANPLNVAITKHDREIIRALIEADVNLNAGQPIHVALNESYLYPIPILIQRGADINQINFEEFASAFDKAIIRDPTQNAEASRIAELLVQKNYNISPSNFLSASPRVQNIFADALRKAGKRVPTVNASLADLIDDAIDRGDDDALRQLKNSRSDFNNVLNNGRSPSTGMSFLRTAIQKQANNGQFMQYFLRRMTNITENDFIGAPLATAARQILHTRLETLKIDQLLQAILDDNVAATIQLLDQGVDPEIRASDGQRPIQLALDNANWDIINAIIQRRLETLSVRTLDAIVNTATDEHHWDIINAILDRGGDTFVPENPDDILLYAVKSDAPREFLHRLITKGAKPDEIVKIIMDLNIKVIEKLVALGASPDIILANLNRPSLEIINRLVAMGGKLDSRMYNIAVNNGNLELFNHLLDLDIPLSPDVNRLLVYSNNPAFFESLLMHGYDLHADGEEVLRFAIIAHSDQMIDYLLNHGAHLNLALEGAMNNKQYNLIEYLLQHGADPMYNDQALIKLALNKNDNQITDIFRKYYPEEVYLLIRPTSLIRTSPVRRT